MTRFSCHCDRVELTPLFDISSKMARKIMLPTWELRAALHYVVHCDTYIAQNLPDSKGCGTAKSRFQPEIELLFIKLG